MVSCPQALERFSASTQEIGGSLRQFTQRLQEEELPNDVLRTQELIAKQVTKRPFECGRAVVVVLLYLKNTSRFIEKTVLWY